MLYVNLGIHESVGGSFSPSDVAGLKLWLKADALSLNNNDAVSSWTDSSGTGNTLTQGAGANQPVFKTNILNSLPGILFDGSNDYLKKTTMTDMVTGTGAWTIFVVFQPSATDSGRTLLNWGSDANSNQSMDVIFRSSNALHLDRYGSSAEATFGTLSTSTNYYIAGIYDGTNRTTRRNGSQITNNTMGTLNIVNSYFEVGGLVSANIWFSGYVFEVLYYNSAISGTDLTNIESYLATKYGL